MSPLGLPPDMSEIVHQATTGPVLERYIAEAQKGSVLEPASEFCALVPPFQAFSLLDGSEEIVPYVPAGSAEPVSFLRLSFASGNSHYKWWEFSSALEDLIALERPVSAMISGNREGVHYEIGLPRSADTARSALVGRYGWIHVSISNDNRFLASSSMLLRRGGRIFLREFRSPPPYHHPRPTLTEHGESPLTTPHEALSHLPRQAVGFIQLVFQGTSEDWQGNSLGQHAAAERLAGYGAPLPWWLAREPWAPQVIAAAGVRVGVLGKVSSPQILDTLALPLRSTLFRGKPLRYIDEAVLTEALGGEMRLLEMIAEGKVLMPGMLVEPEQMVPCFHLPTVRQINSYPLQRVEVFSVPQELRSGIVHLGDQKRGDEVTPAYLPARLEFLHVVIFGRYGFGKSCEEENIILQHAARRCGLLVLDPARHMVTRVAKRLDKESADRAIWIDFFGPDKVPCLNLFEVPEGTDINKLTDDYVSIVKSWHPPRDLGSIQERIIAYMIRATLSVPGLRITDAEKLWDETTEGKQLRRLAIAHAPSERDRRFWQTKYRSYSRAEVARALDKLPFLADERLARVFSQPGKIDVARMMKERRIILVPADAAGGVKLARTICGMFASLAFHAGLARGEDEPPFHIVVDELQYVPTRDIEAMFRQLRKFRVGVTVGIQQISQLEHKTVQEALNSAGTIIALDVTYDDAYQLFKRFEGLLEPKDFMRKGVGRAHAVIGEHFTSFTTPPPPELTDDGYFEEIRRRSYGQYYAPVPDGKRTSTLNVTSGQDVRRPRGIPPHGLGGETGNG